MYKVQNIAHFDMPLSAESEEKRTINIISCNPVRTVISIDGEALHTFKDADWTREMIAHIKYFDLSYL